MREFCMNFLNFDQKIEKYIEDDNSNFTLWANKPGLQNFADIIASHARKCYKSITPCFNGFKVHIICNIYIFKFLSPISKNCHQHSKIVTNIQKLSPKFKNDKKLRVPLLL